MQMNQIDDSAALTFQYWNQWRSWPSSDVQYGWQIQHEKTNIPFRWQAWVLLWERFHARLSESTVTKALLASNWWRSQHVRAPAKNMIMELIEKFSQDIVPCHYLITAPTWKSNNQTSTKLKACSTLLPRPHVYQTSHYQTTILPLV